MKASVFIATSLDGFIARQNGDIDWLEAATQEETADHGYKKFMDSVDVLVMGRHSYEKVLTFGDWPYGSMPVVVLSSRTLTIPEQLATTVEAMSCSPTELVTELSNRGTEHLYEVVPVV